MVIAPSAHLSTVHEAVAAIPDPEIPVISIEELGILRGVEVVEGTVVVTITPTYSGCPAMEMIRSEILAKLADLGIDAAEVRTVYSPAWTTEWMDDDAKRKLDAYGIAPPGRDVMVCPQCRGSEITTVSPFGSTACKSLMVCSSCGEPFDWFKDF